MILLPKVNETGTKLSTANCLRSAGNDLKIGKSASVPRELITMTLLLAVL